MPVLLLERHAGPGRLLRVQGSAVSAEHGNGGPLGQYRNGRRVQILERSRGINDFAVHDGQHGFYSLDLLFRNGEIIFAQHDHVRQLTGNNRSFFARLGGKPGAPLKRDSIVEIG